MLDNSGGEEHSPQIETPTQDNSQEQLTKERWAQQLAGSKQEAERHATRAATLETRLVNKEIALVEANNEYFLELLREDPDLAEKVAKQGFKMSAKEASEKVRGVKTTWNAEFDYDSIVENLEKRAEHKQAMKTVNKMFESLSEEDRNVAKAKFDRLAEGKTLTVDEATEYAEMATLYVRKDSIKKDHFDISMAAMASTGLGSSVKEKKEKSVEGAKDLAEALGLGHLYAKK